MNADGLHRFARNTEPLITRIFTNGGCWRMQEIMVDAGEGGDDDTASICEDGDESCRKSFTIEAEWLVGLKCAFEGCFSCDGFGGHGLCFFNIVQNIGEGYVEFACTGVAGDLVIMPFNDMGECADAEVICFCEKFSFTQHRYAVVCFFAEFVEPSLCIGQGEDEFDEVGFVEHGESFRF